MNSNSIRRQRAYIETRCEEVLRAAADSNSERLLELVRHHLQNVEDLLPDNDELNSPDIRPLNEIAQIVLAHRVVPAAFALVLMTAITYPGGDHEDQ